MEGNMRGIRLTVNSRAMQTAVKRCSVDQHHHPSPFEIIEFSIDWTIHCRDSPSETNCIGFHVKLMYISFNSDTESDTVMRPALIRSLAAKVVVGVALPRILLLSSVY